MTAMPREPILVTNPLGSAAEWIGGGSRELTSYTLQRVTHYDKVVVCGITGVLAANVKIKMCYDMDPIKGFHVDAMKNGERRTYALPGVNPTTGYGIDPGSDWYDRGLRDLNNRIFTDGEAKAVAVFISGQI